ncbi:MAG: hypothetical protein AAF497_10480 [Planctomycetota bacterium]
MRISFALVFVLLASSIVWGQLGDFNADGTWNCQDVDPLANAIATGSEDLSFDMNGDGVLSFEDGMEWLAVAGAQNLTSGNSFQQADFNLDGVVDASDRMTWNANKFTNTTGFCSGNATFDTGVDVPDYNIWNALKFTAAGAPIEPSYPSSEIDGVAEFYYDPATGIMSLNPQALEIFCFSVFGVSPEEFLLNGGDVGYDPGEVMWDQSYFAEHAKWFSMDNSGLEGLTAIALYEPGLTSDAFEIVTFGTTDGIMGQGQVIFLEPSAAAAPAAVPEPSGACLMIVSLLFLCMRPRK